MIVRSKANAYLNEIFSKNNWIGLSTTTPDENGKNFTEPPTTEEYQYDRVQLTVMGTANDGEITNEKIIYFPESRGDWGFVTHYGIFTAQEKSKAEEPIYWGEIYQIDPETGERTKGLHIGANKVPIFRKNYLVVGLCKSEDELSVPEELKGVI